MRKRKTTSYNDLVAPETARYRRLEIDRIAATLEKLSNRIGERFPGSGLFNVSRELISIVNESSERLQRIARPHWPIRAAAVAAVVGVIAIIFAAATKLKVAATAPGVSELAQGIEATINDIIYLGVALFFLGSLETRAKRREALAALHELRSIVHIIDMHQLTKDPEQFVSGATTTPSSPQRTMTRFELARYLDYCSELLSLTSKVAALHVQHLNDSVVLEAVNDVETLSAALSGKIWQKIMILDTIAPGE